MKKIVISVIAGVIAIVTTVAVIRHKRIKENESLKLV